MATKNNANNPTVTATTSEASAVNNQAERKTLRVLETRDDWSVVFRHLVRLVAAQAKGEALPDDPRKGFAFKKAAEQPHVKGYAFGLLAGFASPKARKVFAAAKYEVLVNDEFRHSIALAIAKAARLAPADRCEATLDKTLTTKGGKKQVRSFADAVLAKLGVSSEAAKEPTAEPTSQPTVEAAAPAKPKRTSRKATKPTTKGGGKQANKKSNGKAVSK